MNCANFICYSARVLFAFALCVMLSGCLPDDEVLEMAFSPSGQQLAFISEQKGLCWFDLHENELHVLDDRNAGPGKLAWSNDGTRIAYVSRPDPVSRIFISDLSGQKPHSAHDTFFAQESPQFLADGRLCFTGAPAGKREPLCVAARAGIRSLFELPGDIISLSVSPDRKKAAAICYVGTLAHLYSFDTVSSRTTEIASENVPLEWLPETLSWSSDSQTLMVLSRTGRISEEPRQETVSSVRADAQADTILLFETDHSNPTGQRIAYTGENIAAALLRGKAELYFSDEKGVHETNIQSGRIRSLSLNGLATSRLSASARDAGTIAVVLEKQVFATVNSRLTAFDYHLLEWQDQLLLAEKYYREGKTDQSYDLYDQIRRSVRHTEDPALLEFLYAANQIRLGRAAQGARHIQQMLNAHRLPVQISESNLWRVLGYAHFLALRNNDKARLCFQNAVRLQHEELKGITSATLPSSAEATLDLLNSADSEMIEYYRKAINSRISGHFDKASAAFRKLLATYPDSEGMQAQYLRALEGFEREVYFYSPSEREMHLTAQQKAAFLSYFLEKAPHAKQSEEVTGELLRLAFTSGQFKIARQLLPRAIGRNLPDIGNVASFFYDYLETPEAQPWLDGAMRHVFLHPDISKNIQGAYRGKPGEFLLCLCEMKIALVDGKTSASAEASGRAHEIWNGISSEERSPELMHEYTRLLAFDAHDAEMRGAYDEAMLKYNSALQAEIQRQSPDFEFYMELKYQQARAAAIAAAAGKFAMAVRRAEKVAGNEIVNPTWERSALTSAVRSLAQETGSTFRDEEKLILRISAATFVGNLNLQKMSRSLLLEGSQVQAPASIVQKCFFELGNCDQNLNDPYNAAEWFSKGRNLSANDYERQWLSYRIAENQLRIGYRIRQNKDILSVLVSKSPGSAVSIRAQELLNSLP